MQKGLILFRNFLIVIVLTGCAKTQEIQQYVKNIPEELSSHMVYSDNYDKLFYSSNREDLFKVYQVGLSNDSLSESKIDIPLSQDVFVRSVSADCRYLSFVADENGNQKYDVFLYDLVTKQMQNLTSSKSTDEGNPQFSPFENKLVWLSSGLLKIYSVVSKEIIYTSAERVKSFLWSSDSLIFYEDPNSNIRSLNTNNYKDSMLWISPAESYVPKMFNYSDNTLRFITDHEGYSKIYCLNLLSDEIDIPVNIEHDIYSPQVDSAGNLHFRMNIDGEILNYYQDMNGEIIKAENLASGVSYQYFISSDTRINLFSDINRPKSIQIDREGQILSIIPPNDSYKIYSKVEKVKTRDNMTHYIFTPLNNRAKGWIVWLHGGPHEQISPRYNVFYNYLNKEGWGIVCINYPGSTGLGNNFEMRNRRRNERFTIQTSYIKETLDTIFKQNGIKNKKVTIVGVSYGAVLAHRFTQDYPGIVNKIIDFSGLSRRYPAHKLKDFFSTHKYLFITGENDFAFDTSKLKFIRYCKITAKAELMVLENEGHYIRRRNSLQSTLNKMITFLE